MTLLLEEKQSLLFLLFIFSLVLIYPIECAYYTIEQMYCQDSKLLDILTNF